MNQLHDFVRKNNKIYFININNIDNNANWTHILISIKKIEFRIYFLYFIIENLFCIFIALYR
jgi:hypothetical protein